MRHKRAAGWHEPAGTKICARAATGWRSAGLHEHDDLPSSLKHLQLIRRPSAGNESDWQTAQVETGQLNLLTSLTCCLHLSQYHMAAQQHLHCQFGMTAHADPAVGHWGRQCISKHACKYNLPSNHGCEQSAGRKGEGT